MKKLAKLFACLFLVLAAGCASLGLPTPTTYNERLAAAYGTVTEIRRDAIVLLTAKKISADDAQNVQNQADAVRAGLDVSSAAFRAGDQAGATSKLATTLQILQALQSYLVIKKGTS